jgi:ABC-type nitrate/sulfonate/bicarbonate transport system permease component
MTAAAIPATLTKPTLDVSRILRAIALPVLCLILWQLWALTLPENTRAPSPARAMATFLELTAKGDLPMSMLQSLSRVLAGFAIGGGLGVLLGTFMGANRAIRANIEPIVEGFRPIAPMAILPIAILWFGTGTPAALAIVSYAAFFPVLLNTIHGVMRVDRKLVQAARTMGVSRANILRRVVFPAALPGTLLGLRLGMGTAWTAIIAAELAVGAKSGGGTSGGIGQMMFVFYAYSVDLNGIVVCMIVVGVVALLLDRVFRAAERAALPWRN